MVADRGYPSDAFREHIWNLGSRPAIPTQPHEVLVACPAWIYHNRSCVERLWARLKEWRAVATCYEKWASSVVAVLCLTATLDWLKDQGALVTRAVPLLLAGNGRDVRLGTPAAPGWPGRIRPAAPSNLKANSAKDVIAIVMMMVIA